MSHRYMHHDPARWRALDNARISWRERHLHPPGVPTTRPDHLLPDIPQFLREAAQAARAAERDEARARAMDALARRAFHGAELRFGHELWVRLANRADKLVVDLNTGRAKIDPSDMEVDLRSDDGLRRDLAVHVAGVGQAQNSAELCGAALVLTGMTLADVRARLAAEAAAAWTERRVDQVGRTKRGAPVYYIRTSIGRVYATIDPHAGVVADLVGDRVALMVPA